MYICCYVYICMLLDICYVYINLESWLLHQNLLRNSEKRSNDNQCSILFSTGEDMENMEISIPPFQSKLFCDHMGFF